MVYRYGFTIMTLPVNVGVFLRLWGGDNMSHVTLVENVNTINNNNNGAALEAYLSFTLHLVFCGETQSI